MAEEVFTVGHINCGGCERTIRTLLGDIEGTGQVAPDHRTRHGRGHLRRPAGEP